MLLHESCHFYGLQWLICLFKFSIKQRGGELQSRRDAALGEKRRSYLRHRMRDGPRRWTSRFYVTLNKSISIPWLFRWGSVTDLLLFFVTLLCRHQSSVSMLSCDWTAHIMCVLLIQQSHRRWCMGPSACPLRSPVLLLCAGVTDVSQMTVSLVRFAPYKPCLMWHEWKRSLTAHHYYGLQKTWKAFVKDLKTHACGWPIVPVHDKKCCLEMFIVSWRWKRR